MEIKELVPKLVEHYQRCIDEMPEVGFMKYIYDNGVYNGICFCASTVYATRIYGTLFINEFTNGNGYFGDTPTCAKSYSEAKELLQIRLNRLKEFL